ncbi:MAG: hypothetical protein M0R17_07440 [Candidatus Omnitrophica bacterium]|nr:hypothetical protein [Candidatus Omnitrophota bacterium]
MLKKYFLLILFILMSCTKIDFNNGDVTDRFVILKGTHKDYSPKLDAMPQYVINNHSVEFDYMIDDNILAANNKNGISKIYGFSEGHHQQNSSARLGFIVIDSIISLYTYCYVNGVSPQQNPAGQRKYIGTIVPDVWYHCRIYRSNGYYIFVQDYNTTVSVLAGTAYDWGYILHPYIGGNFTLNKNVIFYIKHKY